MPRAASKSSNMLTYISVLFIVGTEAYALAFPCGAFRLD